MLKFKVKGKRDKGWESIRKAVKREWDKAIKKKASNKGGTKKLLQSKEEEDSEEEDEELEEEEEEESAGEDSQEEEEEKNEKGKIYFFRWTGGTKKVGQGGTKDSEVGQHVQESEEGEKMDL